MTESTGPRSQCGWRITRPFPAERYAMGAATRLVNEDHRRAG